MPGARLGALAWAGLAATLVLNAGSLVLGVLDRSAQAAFPQLFELLVLVAYGVMGGPKYDAAGTLDAFSGRVATEALQPSQASLWLRTAEPPASTQ